MWEADFLVGAAGYGAKGVDPAYTAGCLFRVVGVLCHALHGYAGRWLINEKGMVASAGALDAGPADFAVRAQALFAHVGATSEEIAATVEDAVSLVADVRAAVGR